MILERLNDHSGKSPNNHEALNPLKKLSPTVVILLVSKDHAGKLSIAHSPLNHQKKLSHTLTLSFQNPLANDGIDIILTFVTVVRFFGTKGLLTSWNVHLVAPFTNDNVTVLVHNVVYVCVKSSETVSTGLPSHQSTVYALAKYLFIFKV